ncbi:MAG: DNA adenine methylase [Candidatus Zixiibacteriota bacterium]
MKVVNVSSVPQRSPFRYPGGKTWLVPVIRNWLRARGSAAIELVEPFAGGGIVSLTAVCENLVGTATMVELDSDVAAVWGTILNGEGAWLTRQISRLSITADTVEGLTRVRAGASLRRTALATLVRNRINRGGILAPGAGKVKSGENGKGLTSRWYPETLRKRILSIMEVRDRLHFIYGDGIEVLRQYSKLRNKMFFIDPPYTVAGRRLYTHSEIDHNYLFDLADNLSGDFLMTYDNCSRILRRARNHGFEVEEIPMKSTHHSTKIELLIGRDLGWLRGVNKLGSDSAFKLI